MDIDMDVDMDDDSITSTAEDTFNEKTEDFLEWLKANGTTVSDKIELVDLREQGAGRAVGMTSAMSTVFSCYMALTSHSGNPRHRRRRNSFRNPTFPNPYNHHVRPSHRDQQ